MKVYEYYGSSVTGKRNQFQVEVGNGSINFKNTTKQRGSLSLITWFINLLKGMFLPKGYPDSVSSDYMEYQIWDTIQAFCSSITRTLATQAILRGSGVGDNTATILSATLTWILKDGISMLGRIMFAYFHSTSLDANMKQWRLFADVLNDIATMIEVLAPVLAPKEYFIYIMCFSGLSYSIVGVAGGCTRATLTLHQAQRDNMADVSAKDGSQETLVNLAALLTSLLLLPYITEDFTLTWVLLIVFTFLHIYTNYRAVLCLVLNTFNPYRYEMVIKHYFSSNGEILSPEEANKAEKLILFSSSLSWVSLGCKLQDIAISDANASKLLDKNTKYIIDHHKTKDTICIAYNHSAEACDVLESIYKAYSQRHDVCLSGADSFLKLVRSKGWDISKEFMCLDQYRWTSDLSSLPMSVEDMKKAR